MLDEIQLTYTSYNGQNLNSPAVSVIRGSTVLLKTFCDPRLESADSVREV
jgi:hypothetical protein